MLTVLFIIVLLMLLGVLPAPMRAWHGGGYWPGGILGAVLLILLILLVVGIR